MNLAALLPLNGRSVSQFTSDWLQETAPIMLEIAAEDDVAKLRERNERLSAALSVLAVLRAAYSAELAVKHSEFAKTNPRPPSGGIKAWEAAADAAAGDVKTTYDFLADWYDVCSKRISVTQTHLRSRAAEVTSFG